MTSDQEHILLQELGFTTDNKRRIYNKAIKGIVFRITFEENSFCMCWFFPNFSIVSADNRYFTKSKYDDLIENLKIKLFKLTEDHIIRMQLFIEAIQ